MLIKESSRDWKEDFTHENGMYQNRCNHCNELFIGHKRRSFCKICGTKKAVGLSSLLYRFLFFVQLLIVYIPVFLLDILISISTDKTFKQCRKESNAKIKDEWNKL